MPLYVWSKGDELDRSDSLLHFLSRPGGVCCVRVRVLPGPVFQQDWGIYFWKDGSKWVGDCRFVINDLFWDDMSRNEAAKA